jgi:spore germination protein
VIIVANLEAKSKMSPWQLAILVAAIGIGTEIIGSGRALAESVGEHEWLAFLTGGILFCGVALLMVKLAEYYPDQDFLDYIPQLWGKVLGNIIIVVFILLFLGYFALTLGIFSRVITIFMFDRTPPEIIGIGMAIACAYCAVQDFGTILRVIQFVFIITVPLFLLVFSTGILSVQFDNLLPLWPQHFGEILRSIPNTYGVYAGYEIILLFFPLVYRCNTSPSLAVASAFGCMGFIYVIFGSITIGVLSAENAKTLAYPAMEVVRFVELPGTFLERLEIYVLGAWIPNVFTSLTLYLYAPAYVLRRLCSHADHRPWVLLLIPWLVFMSTFFTDMNLVVQAMATVIKIVGLSFSFIIIPMSLALAWFKKRRKQ